MYVLDDLGMHARPPSLCIYLCWLYLYIPVFTQAHIHIISLLRVEALSPPSLRRFASRGLLPVWLRWDVASLLLVWRFEDFD